MKWKLINLPAGRREREYCKKRLDSGSSLSADRQAQNDSQTTRLYGQTLINETESV